MAEAIIAISREILNLKHTEAEPEFLINRNFGIINVFSFKPLYFEILC